MNTLLFDVESSPNIAYVWGKYETDALGAFIKERQIISVAWKWLGQPKTHVLALPDLPTYKRNPDDNRGLIVALHELFQKADIVIGHNVDEFDDKMANTDFIKHKLPPPPPHKTVCTLKLAKSRFRFNSNSLDNLGAFLGLGRKVKHEGFGMWEKCLAGDLRAWKRMRLYNVGDVHLLEKVYLALRPWAKNHPDVNARSGVDACPKCGSKHLESRGFGLTLHGKYPRFQCKACHGWCRGVLVRTGVHFR